VWDVESWEALSPLKGHSGRIYDVALTADGRRAVSASDDTTLKVWDVESGRPRRALESHRYTPPPHAGWINGVALGADSQRAVSASDDHTLKVWDLASGKELCTLAGHSGSVNGVALSADGRLALSASVDKSLKVWDLKKGVNCAR
jgi:WD40 repeat protein